MAIPQTSSPASAPAKPPASPVDSVAMRREIEVDRIAHLFARLPLGVVASLIGVCITFALLLEVRGPELAKGWTAYMLSTLGYAGWLWHVYNNSASRFERPQRWELFYTCGALAMGLGWGVLGLYIFPGSGTFAQFIVLMIGLDVAFCAAVFAGVSYFAFIALLLPALAPVLYFFCVGPGSAWFAFSIVMSGFSVALAVAAQLIHRHSLMENVMRRIQSESLLEEQQAIFQSATVGIAVIERDRIVKANPRLGELLGRRLADLMSMPLAAHFSSIDELDKLLAESEAAFRNGKPYHGLFRLRRADGSEFWAEISGRRMEGQREQRHVWLIGDAPMSTAAQQYRH